MFKTKNGTTIAVTAIIVMTIFVIGMELSKSNARSSAIKRFNARVAGKLDERSKIAALVEINVMLHENKSWFGLSNSRASVENPNRESRGDGDWIMSWFQDYEPEGTVTTYETYRW